MRKENSNDLVVITGCDSGIGKSLAEVFLNMGFTVAISWLEKNPFKKSENLHDRKMDITKKTDIARFSDMINRLCKEGHELKYLIDNAGIAMGGPVENIPLEIYRRVFEVNFFGLISLTQKLLPNVISAGGRIVINGSMAGRIAIPFLSPYNSSKFALEGFCDSFRMEMRPLGVKVILLEPGGITTPIWTKAKKQDTSFVTERYRESMNAFEKAFIDPNLNAMTSEKAALLIYRKITSQRPGARYIIAESIIKSFLPLLIPKGIFDRLINKLFKMNYGR